MWTGENLIKYQLWKDIIAEAKKVIELAGHDIEFVPEMPEYKVKSNSYEDWMQ